MITESEIAQSGNAQPESAQSDTLYLTQLAADYAQRADACSSPVLALGLRRLAAGYLDLAKRLDAEQEGDAPRRDAA